MSAELLARLKAYVTPGASVVSAGDDAFLQACLNEAVALVDNLIGSTVRPSSIPALSGWVEDPPGSGAYVWVTPSTVPLAVLERAYIETGSELYARRSAPMGISQFASPDGAAIRIGRDPLAVARTILQPFLPGGFA